MPPRPYEIYLKLPGFDCGICEAPGCMTFARRLAARRASADLCLFIRDNIAEVERIASAAEFPRPVSGKGISMIKPCINDPAKVMGEAQLAFAGGSKPAFGFFDAITMNYLLRLRYPDLKFSFKLGSAKLQLADGSRVLVFENGYLSIREVKDAEMLNTNIDHLAILLQGAAICPRCASTVLESSFGGCGSCQKLARPALSATKPSKLKLDCGKNALDTLIGIPGETFNEFDSLLKDLNLSSKEAARDRLINSLLDKLLKTEKEEERTGAMLLVSLFTGVYRAVEAKSRAGDEAVESWLLLQKSWNLIKNFDKSGLRALLKESEMRRSRILKEIIATQDKMLLNPLVIANCAFFIASSLKPLGKS